MFGKILAEGLSGVAEVDETYSGRIERNCYSVSEIVVGMGHNRCDRVLLCNVETGYTGTYHQIRVEHLHRNTLSSQVDTMQEVVIRLTKRCS